MDDSIIIKSAFDYFINTAQYNFEINPPIEISTDLSTYTIKDMTVNIMVDPYFHNITKNNITHRYICWLSMLSLKYKRENIINYIREDVKTKIIDNLLCSIICLTDINSDLKHYNLYKLNVNNDYKKLIDKLIEKYKLELSKKYFYEGDK